MLLAVCQELGVEDKLIPRIASPFAGGMGRAGEVCGTVSGGLMAIGVFHGRDDSSYADDDAQVMARELQDGFRAEMRNLYCRDLTGMDLSTPEGLEAFRASDVKINVCLRAGGVAYDIVMRLLKEHKPG